jgi:FkbM family methyltransferase
LTSLRSFIKKLKLAEDPLSPIQYEREGDMNNPTLAMRAFKFFYKNPDFKLAVLKIFRKLIFQYIAFLNQRRLSIVTRNGTRVVKEINGSKMCLDVDMDDGLCRYLMIADIREAYITETMKKELQEGDIVVDIGANVGYYALLEAKIIGEKGRVYAIEPIPETIELLKENVKLNNYSNIEIYQLAIGDKTRIASMYVGKWLNRSRMKEIDIKSDVISHEISTQVSTLDDFLEKKPYPDIIRMDVEAYEYQIIKGMKRTLERKLPLKLFMEFHFRLLGKEKCTELLRTLKSAGFEIADATCEIDERCITQRQFLGNMASYLNSKVHHLPLKGHLNITIDEILSNAVIRKYSERALDLCFRLGTLEILFKRTITDEEN